MDNSVLDSRVKHLSQILFNDKENREKFEDSLFSMQSGKTIFLNLDTKTNPIYQQDIPDEWNNIWNISSEQVSNNSYSMDCSSVFMASPIIEVVKEFGKNSVNICDCCAAPGGKALLNHYALDPKLHLANEKINNRVKSLISNFSNFNIKNAGITCGDLNFLNYNFSANFEVVIMDVPCSGQSLISRGVNNLNSLTRVTIDRSSHIQKSIMNKAAKLTKGLGYLIYSTCTFSKDENEKVIEWFLRKNPNYTTVEVPHIKNFQSQYTDNFCYRLWPYQGLGSGGFTCLLKNNNDNIEDKDINFEEVKKRSLWQSIAKI